MYYCYKNYLYLKAMMMYKSNFLLTMFFDFIGMLISVLFYKLIYQNTNLTEFIPIWQVFLLIAIVKSVNDLYALFFSSNISAIPDKILYGGLDNDLIKPINFYFNLLVSKLNLKVIFNLITDIVLFIVIIMTYQVSFTYLSLVNFVVLIVLAIIIKASCMLMIVIGAFHFVKIGAFTSLFTSFFDLSIYPAVIYKNYYVKWFLTYIIPVLIIGNTPLKGLIDFDIKSTLGVFLLTICFTSISLLLLHKNIKYYTSASS